MKQIDKYIKRNKHECIWDLGLYILLTVGRIPLSGIIPLLRGLLLHLFFNIHIIFFSGGTAGSGGIVLGFVCFCFYCLDNNQSGVPLSPPFKS